MADHPPLTPARVRVEFEDRHILSKRQRSDGLRRCWLLLRPQFSTVADVAAHLTVAFDLTGSCPDGIVLCIDEYVLPPFESVAIFRDKDIVRVRKKLVKQRTLDYDNYDNQTSDILETRSLLANDVCLAIEDSDGNLVDYGRSVQDACDAEANLKRKREHSNNPKQTKRKKLKRKNYGEPIITVEEKVEPDHEENLCKPEFKRESSESTKFDELNASPVDIKKKKIFTVDIRNGHEGEDCCAVSGQLKECGSTEKLQSRSARRKKAKRQLLREMAKLRMDQHTNESQNVADVMKGTKLDPHIVDQKTIECPKELEKPTNGVESEMRNDHTVERTGTELVPVVVRPGHIRFESSDDEHGRPQSNGQMEIVQWNGATNKKKGQKWGREKTSRRNSHGFSIRETDMKLNTNKGKNVDEKDIISVPCTPLTRPLEELMQWNGETVQKGQKWGREKTSSSNNEKSCNRETIVKLNSEEAKHGDENNINFESLSPLNRPPKKGDVLVYRMVELSSLWSPELSSFRVGRVSSYDDISLKITLLPVPEYPTATNDEKDAEQLNTSVYLEDDSLEIEYSSLVDVRLLNACESEATVSNDLEKRKTHPSTPSHNPELSLVKYNANGSIAPVAERSSNSGWEQIDKALNEKKTELKKKDDWGTWTRNENAFVPWPYRGPRRHALGPTLAFLRGLSGNGGNSSGKGKNSKPR